jgi:hypothetical protein
MAIFNSYVSLPEGNPGFQHSKLLFHQGFISQKKTQPVFPELENKSPSPNHQITQKLG